MTKDLEQEIQQRARFQIDDIFGKARIRKALYEYDCLRRNKNQEIDRLKEITVRQSEAVTAMVVKTHSLEKENALLKSYIEKNDEAKKNMSRNNAILEKDRNELEEMYLELKRKHELLIEDHDRLLNILRERCPDLEASEVA